jgi:hypothetical protein
MTARRTTRIAALGAGALLALGIYSATPAGASDGAQADVTVDGATVNAQTTDVINQTLNLVNQACVDAARTGEAVTSFDALPILGSLTRQVEAQPLRVNCTASADGSVLGVSAAGVEALVQAIVPGVDVSSLIPSLDVNAASAPATNAPVAQAGATAGESAPVKAQGAVQSPAVRASASAPRAAKSTTAAANTATPASASGSLAAQTIGSPGALARTGAGVGALGLLGSFLFGAGRLFAFGRKLINS